MCFNSTTGAAPVWKDQLRSEPVTITRRKWSDHPHVWVRISEIQEPSDCLNWSRRTKKLAVVLVVSVHVYPGLLSVHVGPHGSRSDFSPYGSKSNPNLGRKESVVENQ